MKKVQQVEKIVCDNCGRDIDTTKHYLHNEYGDFCIKCKFFQCWQCNKDVICSSVDFDGFCGEECSKKYQIEKSTFIATVGGIEINQTANGSFYFTGYEDEIFTIAHGWNYELEIGCFEEFLVRLNELLEDR
jgi:hypothetical protein